MYAVELHRLLAIYQKVEEAKIKPISEKSRRRPKQTQKKSEYWTTIYCHVAWNTQPQINANVLRMSNKVIICQHARNISSFCGNNSIMCLLLDQWPQTG